jgi:CBS domain containing-hemolysin-like protein
MIAKIIGDDPRTESEQELAVRILEDGTFLVQAQMDLESVNELLDLNLPLLDEYQTLGGFLIYQYQKIPVQGETLHYDNLELTVISAQGPRLDEIRIHRQEPTAVKLEDISVLGIASVMSKPGNTPTDDVTNDIDEDSSKDQRNGF